MKICNSCQRINLDDAEVCISCGDNKFTVIIFPNYDSDDPYSEKEDDNEFTRVA